MKTERKKEISEKQEIAQAVLRRAKKVIREHSEHGITLAGVEHILDRLMREYEA
jgi:hypothetical protein